MNFEDMQSLWRSQDTRPPFAVDEYILRYIIEQRRLELGRFFLWELAGVYSGTLIALVMTSLFIGGMYVNPSYRTPADILLVIGGVGPLLAWTIALHVGYLRRKRLEPRFTSPLRDAIERDLQRIDYEISRRTFFRQVLLMNIAPLVSAIFMLAQGLRLNDMAPPVWIGPFMILMIIGSMVWSARSNKRVLERRFHPQREELRELRDKLS